MVKFNMRNVSSLLSYLYLRADDGKHYPMYKDAVPIEEVLDEEAAAFFRRIYRTLDSTLSKEET